MMSTVRTDEPKLLNRIVRAWLLITLFLLPLYPKIGLLAVSGTYIPVRADDVLNGILGLLWVASLIVERRWPAVPRLVGAAAGLWIAVTFVSLLIGAFALQSIGLFTGAAFWAKPLEYLLLGWVCYDLISTGRVKLRGVLATILLAAGIVIVYGFLEHFRLVPRLPGIAAPPGAVSSTIGDLHELAAYVGIIGVVLVALWHRASSTPARIGALLLLTLIVADIFWTGARSEFVALAVCLLGLLVWRPARIPAFIGIAAMAFLFASPFLGNLIPRPAPPPDPGGPPVVVTPPAVQGSTVTDRFFGEAFGSSFNERFNVKWRAFIDETARSPIIGLGPSAATEAADGYYMRAYVESGVLGLASFLILVGAVFISVWRAARRGIGLNRALAVGMVAATVFVALVSVLIDTWVASRVMELYAPLVGATLGVAALVTAVDEAPIQTELPALATSSTA